jgi:tripartite-type tricarboxylate transporter receptor subunit TctC
MGACKRYALLLGCLVLTANAPVAYAQDDYPNKPIRLISPFAPGGSTTYTARLIGQQLTEAWGQQVVVDNRAGANTVIGTRLALSSNPDGYTLLILSSALAGNHTLVKTPYDALKDIAPIATVMSYESVLVVPPSLPVKRVKDLVALAKAKPGQITFGTSSTGGATHILAELFNAEANIKTLRVPYKGGGPAVVDLMGGHIHFFLSNPVKRRLANSQWPPARDRGHRALAPRRLSGRSDLCRRRPPGRLIDQLAGRGRTGRHTENPHQ